VRSLEIKGATETDIPGLVEIRYAAFSKYAPLAYSERKVETLLGDIDERELAEMIKNRQLFIARKKNKVVGLAGWKGTSSMPSTNSDPVTSKCASPSC
jgi:hypothetical protein